MITIDDVRTAAESHGLNYEKVVTRDDGSYQILFSWEPHNSYLWWGGTGFLQSEKQCIDFAYDLFTSMSTEDIMKLLKNDKLFPHIRGVMLKDKRVTLKLSGKVNVTEMKGGGRDNKNYRAELHFTNHAKTAVVNQNQVLTVIEVYGDETNDWKGAPVSIYGEEGEWFGKHQWGIRVDLEETKKQAAKAGYAYDRGLGYWTKKNNGTAEVEDSEAERDSLVSHLDDIGRELYGDEWAEEAERLALGSSFGRVRTIDAMAPDELREVINGLEIIRQPSLLDES